MAIRHVASRKNLVDTGTAANISSENYTIGRARNSISGCGGFASGLGSTWPPPEEMFSLASGVPIGTSPHPENGFSVAFLTASPNREVQGGELWVIFSAQQLRLF